MRVRFWMSRPSHTEEFICEVSDDAWRRHGDLTARDSRMRFWREETGDERFDRACSALVSEPV